MHDDRITALLRDAFPRIATAPLVARCRRWLDEGSQRTLLALDDPDYPPLLRRSPDRPRLLFVDGDPLHLWHPSIAIVGTRAPTAAGRDNAHAFASELARRGWCITSGMAAGIDTMAHRAALGVPGGRTVAILGSGIDVPFPISNRALMRTIGERGVVASEYPPGEPARPGQFPRRNRIVAGLSLGTLVIEAAYVSGALITGRLAAEAGREVFALPSSIHNPLGRGCHRLIREGALLVESVDEIEAALAPLATAFACDLRGRLGATTSVPAAPQHGSSDDDADTKTLWEALTHDPTPMAVLVTRSGLTAAKVASILLLMEVNGRVRSEHGRYSRKPTLLL